MGTLGAGNHYAEIQVIDKVFDEAAARKMGIDQEGQVRGSRLPGVHSAESGVLSNGRILREVVCVMELVCFQVCIMLHSGSRGLGHQVATDALTAMDRAMARDGIQTNDRQLACARINSRVRVKGLHSKCFAWTAFC